MLLAFGDVSARPALDDLYEALIREDPDSSSGGQPRYAMFLNEAKRILALA